MSKELERGDRFPYDGGETFWETAESPPPPDDWAHRAARGICADLKDRRGVGQELDQIDHETRTEIVATMARIIREAHADEQ